MKVILLVIQKTMKVILRIVIITLCFNLDEVVWLGMEFKRKKGDF